MEDDFVNVLIQEPASVFLADGSLVKVMEKSKKFQGFIN